MNKIVTLSFTETRRDPRVLKQIISLKENFQLTAVGFGNFEDDDIEFYSLRKRKRSFFEKIIGVIALLTKKFEMFYWSSPAVKESSKIISALQGIDLIIANDLETLPMAIFFKRKLGCKVFVDLHELTCEQHVSSYKFAVIFKHYWEYIGKNYLSQVDLAATVSNGLAKEYHKRYKLDAELIRNVPQFQDLKPQEVDGNQIRLVHHGGAIPNRRLEFMIDLVINLGDRFTIDFYLVKGASDNRYYNELVKQAEGCNRIKFLDPVPTLELPQTLNKYDLGIYLLAPQTLNQKFCLPNKLFEYIQARLGIIVWPGTEMADFVRSSEIGIVTDQQSITSAFSALNRLNDEDIYSFKIKSNLIAKELSTENPTEKYDFHISKILGNSSYKNDLRLGHAKLDL